MKIKTSTITLQKKKICDEKINNPHLKLQCNS